MSRSYRRSATAVLGILAAAATAVVGVFAAAPASAASTPAKHVIMADSNAIADSYIVVLKDADFSASANLSATSDSMAAQYDATVGFTYASINGFSAHMSAAEANRLAQDSRVAYVEQDQTMHLDATQSGATQGLDRIDQRNLPLNGTYNFPNSAGSGVNAYIIDTGIRTTHNDFGGRAIPLATAINDGRGAQDCNGHGTHVSGTVGGSEFGVAKNVTLNAVRVLDCNGSGSLSGVIAGVNFVAQNADLPAVANMSLGGGVSTALDNAVNSAVNAGVVFGVAAGNADRDACTTSPARAANAITVAASTWSNDSRAFFSNFGRCVDIFAPGLNITSDWNGSDNDTNTISGTSMATPHVVGVAALYLGTHPGASPSQVSNAIESGATSGVISDAAGSPNLLLFNGIA